MNTEAKFNTLDAADFARRFSLRASNLMWLLGAGASAAAGIPTAGDMIWEFKQQLFISQRRVSPKTVDDLSSPAIRAKLQDHIDSSDKLPTAGASDEYAALFEAAYPSETDRSTYLDAKITGAKPSYGHIALATLMRAQQTRLVWTTNFDTLVADACAKVYGTTGSLTTVALDAPELAHSCIVGERWPVEIKLHGDFRSSRLKNTKDELRDQDARLSQILVDSCRRFGLVVVGYSGRDDSIMDALESALQQPNAFPKGIFWLHRGEAPPLPRVTHLLSNATKEMVEAALISVDNFDEALRDLMRLMKGMDTVTLDAFAVERRRWSGAPPPGGGRSWPEIRLNALPVTRMPTVCRRVSCQVGGYTEVREAVLQAGVDVLIARTQAGVLAFGADADVRTAFESHNIIEFDLHTIEPRRLTYESGERSLLRNALIRAIVRQYRLDHQRRRSTDLLVPADLEDVSWGRLLQLVKSLGGTVEGYPGLRWREGVSTRLDWANERLWLLFEPRIVFYGITDDNKAIARDFRRERTVKRYNSQLNDLIVFWSALLSGKGREIRALNVSDGVDAVFCLSADTAFSRRARL